MSKPKKTDASPGMAFERPVQVLEAKLAEQDDAPGHLR